jgi:hypothetical protein
MAGLGPAAHVFWPTQTRKTRDGRPTPGHDSEIDELLSTSVGISPIVRAMTGPVHSPEIVSPTGTQRPLSKRWIWNRFTTL